MLGALVEGCKKNKDNQPSPAGTDSTADCGPIQSTGTPLNLDLPFFFPTMPVPPDNPLTVEGVKLGRYLFWDKKLSRNQTMSCGSCHFPGKSFADSGRFSTGVDGIQGTRSAMPLINLAWAHNYFWDGRAATLEKQIFEPVRNHIELDENWVEVAQRIAADPEYPPMFEAAFGGTCIDSTRISYAIAQFERTMVSYKSKFDRWRYYGQGNLTPSEYRGLEKFLAEGGDPSRFPGGQNGGDCFHCHGGSLTLFTDEQFHNNGLDSVFTDLGRGEVTGNPADYGRFKTPTLRNIALTAPYMHDGRYQTLQQVIEHYDSGGVPSPTIDPFMKYAVGGDAMTDQTKQDIINFLLTLTDTSFVNNPAFTDPH